MFKWFGKVNYTPYTKVTDFAQHLKDGRLMGTRCKKCDAKSFPPRADCEECMSDDFEFTEMSGKVLLPGLAVADLVAGEDMLQVDGHEGFSR